LGVQSKFGGKFHLKLNNGERPIANKYREGKMQRTLKRELKGLEIVKREAIGAGVCPASAQAGPWSRPAGRGVLCGILPVGRWHGDRCTLVRGVPASVGESGEWRGGGDPVWGSGSLQGV